MDHPSRSLSSLLIDLRHNNPQRASKLLEDLLECSAPVTQQTVGVEMGLSIDRSLVYRKLYGKLDTGARPCTSGGAGDDVSMLFTIAML